MELERLISECTAGTLGGVDTQFLAVCYGYALGINDNGWVVGQSLATSEYAPPGREGLHESYGCVWQQNDNGIYEAMPLHALCAGTDWLFEVGSCISRRSIIGATGSTRRIPTLNESSSRNALLSSLPELCVDADRDGAIDIGGNFGQATSEVSRAADISRRQSADQTTQDNPYKFWINNNHDGYSSVSEEASMFKMTYQPDREIVTPTP